MLSISLMSLSRLCLTRQGIIPWGVVAPSDCQPNRSPWMHLRPAGSNSSRKCSSMTSMSPFQIQRTAGHDMHQAPIPRLLPRTIGKRTTDHGDGALPVAEMKGEGPFQGPPLTCLPRSLIEHAEWGDHWPQRPP
ncbi:hypothetical protein An01g05955 [Aspergillus niger]|uniref:Uncharacterized protein n=2 Tax=Aspergillus niger TaxID=5061 RepID=A2Q8Y0_ASPNC|nr:hypothetical protein An01g05955 [Aspergillus niger]CAK37070.1 hypothetical protein An01g05955 [Aspergillus niger]